MMFKAWLAIALLSGAMSAQSAGGHEHGVGHLSLAIEGHQLQMMLSLPEDDLSLSADSRFANTDVKALLLESPLVFVEGAGCKLVSSEIEGEQHSHDHDSHDHDSHDSGEHENIELNYLWQCLAPVSSADVSLFQYFSSLQIVKAQIVWSQEKLVKQKIQQLTRANAQLVWR